MHRRSTIQNTKIVKKNKDGSWRPKLQKSGSMKHSVIKRLKAEQEAFIAAEKLRQGADDRPTIALP